MTVLLFFPMKVGARTMYLRSMLLAVAQTFFIDQVQPLVTKPLQIANAL